MKATTATKPAMPNSRYSFSIFSRARGSISEAILSHRGDDQRHGRAEREGGRPQGPAGVDVAEVVGAEVDAGEPDQGGDRDPGGEHRGPPRHPDPQAED